MKYGSLQSGMNEEKVPKRQVCFWRCTSSRTVFILSTLSACYCHQGLQWFGWIVSVDTVSVWKATTCTDDSSLLSNLCNCSSRRRSQGGSSMTRFSRFWSAKFRKIAENYTNFVTGKLAMYVAFGKSESSVHENQENFVSNSHILRSMQYIFAEKRDCNFCPNAIRTQIFVCNIPHGI
jgi:hypothetical protein